MKRFLSIITVLVLSITMVGCSSSKPKESASTDKKVLTIGLECDYAPYNWTTTKDKKSENALPIEGSKGYCDGYDMWMANQLANKTGYSIKVKKMSWDGLLPALDSNVIDLVLAGMSPTDERKKQIAFSPAYYTFNPTMAIVVKKDSNLAKAKELKDFAGTNISAQQGTTETDLLSQIKDNQNKTVLPDYNSLVQATKSGTIDGYLAELGVAQAHVKANDDLTLVDVTNKFKLTEGESTVAIGMRKDDEAFIKMINDALAKIDEKDRVTAMETISANSNQ